MHLQQPKKESRRTGGPQYWLQNPTDMVRVYLRDKGAVAVALVTPYGATKSEYFALHKDRKLDDEFNVVPANAQHDRIQQGLAKESIGESIRKWYGLPKGDFERIDIDIDPVDDRFYVTPLKYKLANFARSRDIPHEDFPLTIRRGYVSQLWNRQLGEVDRDTLNWSRDEIYRIMKDHRNQQQNVHEVDILRASGPLQRLGMALGPYVVKGYDCFADFNFLRYPTYSVAVEVKKRSKGFDYQEKKYGPGELSRAIILCAFHDKTHLLHRHIDVIELDALCDHLQSL